MASRVDWSFGPGHGPVSGAVNAALVTGACAAYAHYRHWAASWALVGGLIVVIASMLIVTAKQHLFTHHGLVMWYRGICWAAASIWMFVVIQQPKWTFASQLRNILWLAGGTAAAALIGLIFQAIEQRSRPQPADAAPGRTASMWKDKVAQDLEDRIFKVCKVGVEVTAVERWKDKSGFTAALRLPDDGTTIDSVKSYEKSLATSLNLGPGCSVEILPSTQGRRTILMRVTQVSMLSQPQPMPAGLPVRSVNDPIPLGVRPDRTVPGLKIRFDSCVMVGQRNSGKSNQLGVILHGLMCCNDVFIAGIDLSGGGRLFRPLIRPWVEGQVPRPPIDFVANSPELALTLTTGLVNVINARTPHYADLMHKHNVDYLPISRQVPQIVLVIDEFATLPDRVKEQVQIISDTGRGAGVSLICCALAAKNSYIPRAVIVQARNRIGMRVSDEAELQMLFDTTWRSGRFDMTNTPVEGFGYVSIDGNLVTQFKGYRLEPHDLIAAAVGSANRRASLDAVSARAWDVATVPYTDENGYRSQQTVRGVFADRWENTLPLMFPNKPIPRLLVPVQRGEGADPAQPSATVTLEDATERLQAARDAARTAREAASGQQLRWEEPPPARARYEAILRESRPVTATQIAEQLERDGYKTARQTVIKWLGEDVERGRVDRLPQTGREVPYLWNS